MPSGSFQVACVGQTFTQGGFAALLALHRHVEVARPRHRLRVVVDSAWARSTPCAFSISSTRIQWIWGSRGTGCSPSRRRRRSGGSRRSARGRARSRTRRRPRAPAVPDTVHRLAELRRVLRLRLARARPSRRPARAPGSSSGRSASAPQPDSGRQRRAGGRGAEEGAALGRRPARRPGSSARSASRPGSAPTRRPQGAALRLGRGSSVHLLGSDAAAAPGRIRLEARRVRVVAVHAEEVGLLRRPTSRCASRARPPASRGTCRRGTGRTAGTTR